MTELESETGLKPILMRSSTPAPNEKVLKYLEGMASSNARSEHGNGDAEEEDLGRSQVSYNSRLGQHQQEEDGEDAQSNEQQGERSENGTILPVREPGPNDPPGPRYESYDSGPSFGNFGPLPGEGNPLFASGNTWQPAWVNQGPNNTKAVPWDINTATGGLTPGNPIRVPLPDSVASPRATTVGIEVESPSSKAKSRGFHSHAPSKKATSVVSNPAARMESQKAPSRAQSRAQTQRDDTPLSPRSGKSRATGKRGTEAGTIYPPLPASAMGGDDNYSAIDSPSSPKSKVYSHSKAPSISPSDSPSQTKVQKSTVKSPSRAGSKLPSPPESPGHRSPPLPSAMSGLNSHQSRPFSPYRHAATNEDLLHAAVRGRAMALTEENEKEPSVVPSRVSKAPSKVASQISRAPSNAPSNGNGKATSIASTARQARGDDVDRRSATPTPSRPHSPNSLNAEEEQIIADTLAKTPRTSYYAASVLEPEVKNSHFHDMDLCLLLQQENDPNVHEVVKRAVRKAVRQRVKRLGMKYDHESIKQYRKSFHDHDPSIHLHPPEEPPEWAKDILQNMVIMNQRIEGLGPKLEDLKASRSFGGASGHGGSRYYEGDEFSRTPQTQTVNIHTQPTGTLADSMYKPADTELLVEGEGSIRHHPDDNTYHDRDDDEAPRHRFDTDGGETHTPRARSEYTDRDDSPGQQYLEEELYKLRQKPQGSQSVRSHRTWEVGREDDEEEYDEDPEDRLPGASGLPTIPDTEHDHPLPEIPQDGPRDVVATPQPYNPDFSIEFQHLPPWQRIQSRLLSWAIIWPLSQFDAALNSTTRGHQVDEVALTIWSTQTYKRYVRTRLTDTPQGRVDRLFVPPNMADAISNAVFNGRHGEACGMLRNLWSPFGLEGMPRLLVVLMKHRSDENHWVVHRFSLPDGALTTYDTHPERRLPDGRPLGWWFAIRVAWPNAIYPDPDHLMQKMVRMHRPMQLPIDNAVAAAGIWRNILMGSTAERSLDLERLRDLINTEVKNLRQRKLTGKLSIGTPRPAWQDMN